MYRVITSNKSEFLVETLEDAEYIGERFLEYKIWIQVYYDLDLELKNCLYDTYDERVRNAKFK